jgi:Zn-dependent protease with chaperone function
MTWWQHWIVGQVDASVTAAVLLAIAVCVRRTLSPPVRSAILLIALVRLALPPWIRSPWSEAAVDLPLVGDTRLLVAAWLHADLTVAAFTCVTSVTLILLARLAWHSQIAGRRWMATTLPAPPALQARVNELARQMEGGGASRRLAWTSARVLQLRVSTRGDGPLATGIRTPLIVLPDTAVDALGPAAMEAVLAHEVAHHARRDLLWLVTATSLRAIVWFNPLAHLIARALVATREDASDDWAVTHTSRDPFVYARALLESARLAAGPYPHASAGAHPMGQRLRRLLDGRSNSADPLGARATAFVLVVAALCLPGAHMPRLSASGQDDRIVIRRVIQHIDQRHYFIQR